MAETCAGGGFMLWVLPFCSVPPWPGVRKAASATWGELVGRSQELCELVIKHSLMKHNIM